MKINTAAIERYTVKMSISRWFRNFDSKFQSISLGVGKSDSRFTLIGGNFAAMYAGQTLMSALCETVIRDRFEAVPPSQRVLGMSEFERRAVCLISSRTDMQLLVLNGAGAIALGLNTDALGSKDRSHGRAFSDALYLHTGLTGIDGILYRSRLTLSPCVAIYDRAISSKLNSVMVGPLMNISNLNGTLEKLEISLRV